MATNRGHRLTLDNITQRFNDFVAVHDINLDVAGGELVALLGPSGCGKSTLLRIMSGFIRQTEGRVLFDGEPVDHLTPSQRGVGIVFQNYALFPHMTWRTMSPMACRRTNGRARKSARASPRCWRWST